MSTILNLAQTDHQYPILKKSNLVDTSPLLIYMAESNQSGLYVLINILSPVGTSIY